MNNEKTIILILVFIVCAGIAAVIIFQQLKSGDAPASINRVEIMKLPEPKFIGRTSLEETLLNRRSIREFKDQSLTLADVSQLLWAAQGVTEQRRGFRTAPSAGALYPLELYVAVGNVENTASGIYKYRPHEHELVKVADGDVREELCRAALGQSSVRDGAIVLVFSVVYERTTIKYGDRGIQYAHMEVGHAAQNVYLQAVSLDLGTVVIGAFYDDKVKQVMGMEDSEIPLCIMPVGKK